MKFAVLPTFALLFTTTCLTAAEKPNRAVSPWGDFVEKDFPFFSSVVDAREVAGAELRNNLTPRGLVLNLGGNLWACFDLDLLRLSCVWRGEEGKPPVTPEALAPGSYHLAGQKTKDGQEFLPKPTGTLWLENGQYAGWQKGTVPVLKDGREAAPSAEEVGRGPLAPNQGQFKGVFLREQTELHAEVDGVTVQMHFGPGSAGADKAVVQRVEVAAHAQELVWIIGHLKAPIQVSVAGAQGGGALPEGVRLETLDGVTWVKVPASATPQVFALVMSGGGLTETATHAAANKARWNQSVETQGHLSDKADAYVVDTIPLPVPNPWKRNVRLADVAFQNDQGTAAGVTFDGDVWHISGLKGDLEKVTWKRFASGLHEPMSLVVKPNDAALYVFDRSGIWKLTDSDGNGEADRYEMFCNLVAQTAETREFPNSMKLGPDGSLYLAKGGQEGTTFGKYNGTVVKVAPDGQSFEVLGYGLRQPFIGVHPKTGLVTASDQQGNYVPSTPISIIEKKQFYGHLPTIAPAEKYPEAIAEPMAWIPHPVNPSGASQTWLVGARMGPVNDELIHVGYNRPELFRVLMNSRFSKDQAAVMTFTRDLDFGPLNAQVNPADGQLYVEGFQVWGTTAKQLSGLARVRYTDKPRVLLKEVTPTDKGLLLRFNMPLDKALATNPASYSAERWNYKRTHDYGSPHLKLDGSTGQEWMMPSSAYLSLDGMSVLVGLPDMKAGVHQMRIGWGLKSVEGLKAENTAYFSPWELATFDGEKEGFGKITVDLTPRAAEAVAKVIPTAEEGARLYQMIGCMACHSIDGTTIGKVGPSWKGIFGTERLLGKGGKTVIADEAYLRESILNPSAKVVKGFEKFDTGMPIYAGILNDSQVDSLVLYIKTLK